MLLNTPFKQGEVVGFRLISGDEIIGEVVEVDNNRIGIKKPCTLAMDPRSGQMGLTPASIMGHPEKTMFYYTAAIIASFEPREDAAVSYKSFATGLQIAKNVPNVKR